MRKFQTATAAFCRSCIFLPVLWIPLLALSQQVPELKKYPLGNSGCVALFPAVPEPVEEGNYPENNRLYSTFSQLVYEGKSYQFCVKLLELKDPEYAQNSDGLLAAFMDYLKSTQNIVEEGNGYKKTGLLKPKASEPALTGYWTDHTGNLYSVAGWANHHLLAVLYIIGEEKFPIQAMQKAFLNGIKFPAGL